MDEYVRLRRQVKMLTIGLVFLGVAVIGLFAVDARRSFYGDTWPNAALGELKVKKLVIIGSEGQPQIAMDAKDGSPKIIIFDKDLRSQMFIGMWDNKLNMLLPGKGDVKLLLNSDGLLAKGDDSRFIVMHAGIDTPYLQIKNGEKANNLTIASGLIQMGDESGQGIRLQSSVPSIYIQDGEGYATTIGKTAVKSGVDGTTTLTTASTLVGSSKQAVTTWPLIKANAKK